MNDPTTHSADQIGGLIAMIAHDLRSPITAIKGFSQLALRQSDLSPQVHNYLSVVLNETNRVAAMIDDLVLLSELDQNTTIPSTALVIDGILQAAIRRSMRFDSTTEIVLEKNPIGVMVRCHPALTERAVALLIGTARKYCLRSERITVCAHTEGDGVLITVLPSGHVATEKLLALRRVVGAKTAVPTDDLSPSGLGLFICRQLIELQGGQVWIEQPTNGSTKFAIMLPGHTERHPKQTPPRGERQQWS